MKRIWVIGGANLDIQATSFKPLIPMDSNPGKVTYSVGGVAHNVASNLARLGCQVNFITALSEDAFSKIVINDCKESEMSLQYCQWFPDYSTSLYLAIAQPEGEMNIAVADMDILSHMDVEKIVPLLNEMDENDLVFLDTNLTVEQIDKIVINCRGRMFCDPISTPKAGKIMPFLSQIEMLKPNLLEARYLLNDKDGGYEELLDGFRKQGLETIVISMGEDGAIARNDTEAYHLNNIAGKVVNTTGAGDSFMAGYMYGQYHERSFLESLQLAMAASSITVESLKTVSDQMNEKILMERLAAVKQGKTEIL